MRCANADTYYSNFSSRFKFSHWILLLSSKLLLELELIQTQMAQIPVLRTEVYAHAMRASQNRKKEVRREKEAQYFQPSLKLRLLLPGILRRLRLK